MATTKELPDLIREFVEMSRAYMRQETVEPAKALGRFASYSISAALVWALGAVLVAIAMMRALIKVLPDGPYWPPSSLRARSRPLCTSVSGEMRRPPRLCVNAAAAQPAVQPLCPSGRAKAGKGKRRVRWPTASPARSANHDHQP